MLRVAVKAAPTPSPNCDTQVTVTGIPTPQHRDIESNFRWGSSLRHVMMLRVIVAYPAPEPAGSRNPGRDSSAAARTGLVAPGAGSSSCQWSQYDNSSERQHRKLNQIFASIRSAFLSHESESSFSKSYQL